MRWVDSQKGEHSEDENGGARVCLPGVTATTCSPPPRRSWLAHLFSLTLHIGAKVGNLQDMERDGCEKGFLYGNIEEEICIELLDETCGRRKGGWGS